MDIQRKIDEIRQKPEHIRLRYVWVMVGISMSVIVGIWVLSLYNQHDRFVPRINTSNYENTVDQFNQGKQSLQDVMSEFQGAMNEISKEEEMYDVPQE